MWRPAHGMTWAGAGVMFLASWTAMMTVMMLPAYLPAALRYHAGRRRPGAAHPHRSSLVAALAYFGVWALLGVPVFAVGAAISEVLESWPVLRPAMTFVPTGAVAMAAMLQFTAWKRHHLVAWHALAASDGSMQGTDGTPWRTGLLLGVHCVQCCAGFTVALIAVGMSDFAAMGAVTAAVSCERLVRDPRRVAQVIGAVTACAAGYLLLRGITTG